MGQFWTACLFLTTLVYGSFGQTCNPNLPSQCYFTGAGTISAGNSDVNKYFAVGGLFDIHEKGDDYCGSTISQAGLLNLLAFYWSVDHFGPAIVGGKGMAVAAVAFDSCMHPDQTVENVLSFSKCKVQVQGLRQQNIVGYIGPYSNMDAARTGMLAADLKTTLISPEANSPDLPAQSSLLQLRPDIDYDLKAIAGFLKAKNFDNVIVIHSDSTFWTHAYSMVMNMIKSEYGVCMVYSAELKDTASDDDIKTIAENLETLRRSKFVLPLMSKEMTKKLMQATATNNDLIFLLTSDIGRDTSYVNRHAVVVEPTLPASNDLNEFNNFLKAITPNATLNSLLNRGDIDDPWLQEFLGMGNQLPDLIQSPSGMKLTVLRTIQSVEILIKGIDQAISDRCGAGTDYQFCDNLRNIAGRESNFFSYIKAGHFGSDSRVLEDDVKYSYFVYVSSEDDYHNIGTYAARDNVVSINEDLQQYGQAFSGSVCETSRLTDCCIPPTTPAPVTDAPTTPSKAPTTTEPDDSIMVKYPRDKEITGAFSEMDRHDDDYGTRFDIDQKWIIALGVLAGLGIVCVLVFEIFILYKMVGKRMGSKWRTMWLGQLLLFGIFLAYLVCFAYLFIPTKATCGITRFGVGVAYAICFAVLLVKLMVILTSKGSESLMPGDVESPHYLKGVYQFLMFTFAVGVQVVINVQWLITVPPEAIQVVSNAGEKVWVCNHYTWEAEKGMMHMEDFVRSNFENHLLSLIYIMVMILIVTLLSLNAHGIITNHRESVFIGLASGFSIPIWIAWGLVGGLNKDKDYGHEFGDACMAFGLLLTATLILFTMFLPKVRQLVNMGVEGIYLEDDRDTIYGGSVIMGPPSFKGKGPSSVIYVNNQGIYSEPVVVGNGDTKMATHLKHPGSTYSAPPTYLKKTESTYGGSRVLRVTDDLKGRHPSNKQRKPLSEVGYSSSGRPRSHKGTLPRSRSQSDLGAL